jgi:hypothetical protein
MNVDPSLQCSMQHNIKVAQAKSSKDADVKVIEEFVLYTFAGMGLTKQVGSGEKIVWVKTDLLKGLESTSELGDAGREPQMKDSVRLVLEDIIETTFSDILRLKRGQKPRCLEHIES